MWVPDVMWAREKHVLPAGTGTRTAALDVGPSEVENANGDQSDIRCTYIAGHTDRVVTSYRVNGPCGYRLLEKPFRLMFIFSVCRIHYAA